MQDSPILSHESITLSMIRWSYVSIMPLSLARLYSIRYLCCRSIVFLVLLCFIL